MPWEKSDEQPQRKKPKPGEAVARYTDDGDWILGIYWRFENLVQVTNFAQEQGVEQELVVRVPPHLRQAFHEAEQVASEVGDEESAALARELKG